LFVSQGGQLVGLMPVLAACHLMYVFSVVMHCISIHVVANKVLSLSLCLVGHIHSKVANKINQIYRYLLTFMMKKS